MLKQLIGWDDAFRAGSRKYSREELDRFQVALSVRLRRKIDEAATLKRESPTKKSGPPVTPGGLLAALVSTPDLV